jgi:hypothetical protein
MEALIFLYYQCVVQLEKTDEKPPCIMVNVFTLFRRNLAKNVMNVCDDSSSSLRTIEVYAP